MMQADTLDFACYAIELKSMLLAHTNRTYAKLRACLVNNLVSTIQTCDKVVEEWTFWRPWLWIFQSHCQSYLAICRHVGMSGNLNIAFRIYKRDLHGQSILACSPNLCLNIYEGLFLRQ